MQICYCRYTFWKFHFFGFFSLFFFFAQPFVTSSVTPSHPPLFRIGVDLCKLLYERVCVCVCCCCCFCCCSVDMCVCLRVFTGSWLCEHRQQQSRHGVSPGVAGNPGISRSSQYRQTECRRAVSHYTEHHSSFRKVIQQVLESIHKMHCLQDAGNAQASADMQSVAVGFSNGWLSAEL